MTGYVEHKFPMGCRGGRSLGVGCEENVTLSIGLLC